MLLPCPRSSLPQPICRSCLHALFSTSSTVSARVRPSFPTAGSSKPARPKGRPVIVDATTEFTAAIEQVDLARVKSRVDAKRRQGGRTFLDHLVVDISAGHGGDGAVAFFRDVHIASGPPSGGNGGPGGDVLIRAVPGLTSLSGIAAHIRGAKGGNGSGKWKHGKRGLDVVIKVPVGTVVREVSREKIKDPWDEQAAEEEDGDEQADTGAPKWTDAAKWKELKEEEKEKKRRDTIWVHYPLKEEDNVKNQAFLHAEQSLKREMKHSLRLERLENRSKEPLVLDLDEPSPEEGIVIARGGRGGLGNPFFASADLRKPTWATRGREGESVRLFLELKLLADVGLVGLPNAGKSTLLRALTNAKAEVAGYAFTTLNPQIGTVQLWQDGGFGSGDPRPISHTSDERELAAMGLLPDAPHAQSQWGRPEEARLTICDNPGLLYRASEDFGLGHTFLRSVERARALVYVVDLSSPAPWDDLYVLKHELEAYREGLSGQARLIVANKADLLGGATGQDEGGGETAESVREKENEAWDKVRRLEELSEGLDVVPVSAKFRLGLDRVVTLLREYVQESRAQEAHTGSSVR